MRVLITRPQPEAGRLADELRERDIDSLIAPMLVVRGIDTVLPDLGAFQALFVTSARGLHAFAEATDARDIAVYAVGGASARAAIARGFHEVVNADGDVVALVAKVKNLVDPADGPLLHPTGAHVAFAPAGALEAAGFKLESVVLYEAVVADGFTEPAAEAMRAGSLDAVLFFSPRTAETFVRLAVDADLAASCANIDALCQSPAIALAAAALPWRRIRTATRPDQTSLLGLLEAGAGAEAGAEAEAGPWANAQNPARAPNDQPNVDDRPRRPPAAATPASPPAAPSPTPPTAAPPINQSRRPEGRRALVAALLAVAFAAGVALWPIILPRIAPDLTRLLGPATGPGIGLEAGGERDLAALEDRVRALETRRPPADSIEVARLETLEALTADLGARAAANQGAERLDALTARVGALAQRLDIAEGERRDGGTSRTRLAARIQTLESALIPPRAVAGESPDGEIATARIDAIEAALTDLREANAARPNVSDDIAVLEAALAELDIEVARVQATVSAQRQARTLLEDRLAVVEVEAAHEARAATHLLAVGQLREALGAARPYRDAWAVVAATAPEGAPPEAMTTLAAYAEAGAATPAMLAARFADMAMAIAAAGAGGEDDWVDEAVGRLRGLVRIRRIGDVAGEGPGAVAARAERLIATGDLPAAAAELGRLTGAAAAVVAPWLIAAHARIAVDEALASLIAAALQGSGPAS